MVIGNRFEQSNPHALLSLKVKLHINTTVSLLSRIEKHYDYTAEEYLDDIGKTHARTSSPSSGVTSYARRQKLSSHNIEQPFSVIYNTFFTRITKLGFCLNKLRFYPRRDDKRISRMMPIKRRTTFLSISYIYKYIKIYIHI